MMTSRARRRKTRSTPPSHRRTPESPASVSTNRHSVTTAPRLPPVPRALLLPGLGLVFLCGGYGPHSALDPAGPQAARIDRLYWLFFWVCAVVWTLVMVFLIAPLFRRRRTPVMASPDEPDLHPEPAAEKR